MGLGIITKKTLKFWFHCHPQIKIFAKVAGSRDEHMNYFFYVPIFKKTLFEMVKATNGNLRIHVLLHGGKTLVNGETTGEMNVEIVNRPDCGHGIYIINKDGEVI